MYLWFRLDHTKLLLLGAKRVSIQNWLVRASRPRTFPAHIDVAIIHSHTHTHIRPRSSDVCSDSDCWFWVGCMCRVCVCSMCGFLIKSSRTQNAFLSLCRVVFACRYVCVHECAHKVYNHVDMYTFNSLVIHMCIIIFIIIILICTFRAAHTATRSERKGVRMMGAMRSNSFSY